MKEITFVVDGKDHLAVVDRRPLTAPPADGALVREVGGVEYQIFIPLGEVRGYEGRSVFIARPVCGEDA